MTTTNDAENPARTTSSTPAGFDPVNGYDDRVPSREVLDAGIPDGSMDSVSNEEPPQPRRERPAPAERADANWHEIASNCLEMAGITALAYGSWLIRHWLGLIVLGVFLLLLGVATGIRRNE
jgi:hypothetical protein